MTELYVDLLKLKKCGVETQREHSFRVPSSNLSSGYYCSGINEGFIQVLWLLPNFYFQCIICSWATGPLCHWIKRTFRILNSFLAIWCRKELKSSRHNWWDLKCEIFQIWEDPRRKDVSIFFLECVRQVKNYYGEWREDTLELLKQNRMSWTWTRLLDLWVLIYFISLKTYFILGALYVSVLNICLEGKFLVQAKNVGLWTQKLGACVIEYDHQTQTLDRISFMLTRCSKLRLGLKMDVSYLQHHQLHECVPPTEGLNLDLEALKITLLQLHW